MPQEVSSGERGGSVTGLGEAVGPRPAATVNARERQEEASEPPNRSSPWSSTREVVPLALATNVRGAMPIPPYEGRRTYFFFADVEPKELMTFGVEAGIPLDDDSMLEVLGHALAYWAIAEEQEVLTLRAFVQDVFDVTLAIYALIRLERGDKRDALRLRAESEPRACGGAWRH